MHSTKFKIASKASFNVHQLNLEIDHIIKENANECKGLDYSFSISFSNTLANTSNFKNLTSILIMKNCMIILKLIIIILF